jgi:phosphatidylglycerophosphate synthase
VHPAPASERLALADAAAWIPNTLSAARFVLAVVWIALAAAGVSIRLPFVALVFAAWATDYLDGYLARRFNVASGVGRWLDSLADVTFVLAALISEAALGSIPFYIPILIAASFSQYALDSTLLAPAGGPIRSRLGHLGGMINYALVIVFAFSKPHRAAGRFVRKLCPLIALFYLAAIAERAWLFYRRR